MLGLAEINKKTMVLQLRLGNVRIFLISGLIALAMLQYLAGKCNQHSFGNICLSFVTKVFYLPSKP